MEKEFLVELTTKTVENGCCITDVIKCADCLFYRDEKRTIQLNEPISKDNLDKFILDVVTLLKSNYGIKDVVVHPAANTVCNNKSSIIFTEQNKIKCIQYYFKLTLN